MTRNKAKSLLFPKQKKNVWSIPSSSQLKEYWPWVFFFWAPFSIWRVWEIFYTNDYCPSFWTLLFGLFFCCCCFPDGTHVEQQHTVPPPPPPPPPKRHEIQCFDMMYRYPHHSPRGGGGGAKKRLEERVCTATQNEFYFLGNKKNKTWKKTKSRCVSHIIYTIKLF